LTFRSASLSKWNLVHGTISSVVVFVMNYSTSLIVGRSSIRVDIRFVETVSSEIALLVVLTAETESEPDRQILIGRYPKFWSEPC
jgi:hypothetical protein